MRLILTRDTLWQQAEELDPPPPAAAVVAPDNAARNLPRHPSLQTPSPGRRGAKVGTGVRMQEKRRWMGMAMGRTGGLAVV